MKIETIEIAGISSALMALRLPYNKEELSDGHINTEFSSNSFHQEIDINYAKEDIELASKLVSSGDEHAKPIRGMLVYADITAPLYFWSELETYIAGHQRLFSASTQNTECRRLSGKALQKAKHDIPYDRPIRKIDIFSYQCLRNIVKQRYNHRVPEWHRFIDWIVELPLADELILPGLERELGIHEAMYDKFLDEGCFDND